MSKLTRDDVFKLAQLAKLDLSDEEVVTYQHELAEILAYVDLLQGLDVTGLAPTNQVTGLVNVTRDDSIQSYGYSQDDLLKNVPHVEGKQIKVKRMIG